MQHKCEQMGTKVAYIKINFKKSEDNAKWQYKYLEVRRLNISCSISSGVDKISKFHNFRKKKWELGVNTNIILLHFQWCY